MTIYAWITLVAMLLAVVVANTDKYAKVYLLGGDD